MEKKIKNIINYIDNLTKSFKIEYVNVIVSILIFYLIISKNDFPIFLKQLFMTSIFRILILSIIVFNGNKYPSTSILISIGFVIMLDKINKLKLLSKKLKEPFSNPDEYEPHECENYPMPGRKILGIVENPDKTCKYLYQEPEDGKIDCSLCLNPPEKGKKVTNCETLDSMDGRCEYEYEEPEVFEEQVDEISEDDMPDLIDPEELEKELKSVDAEIENMKETTKKIEEDNKKKGFLNIKFKTKE